MNYYKCRLCKGKLTDRRKDKYDLSKVIVYVLDIKVEEDSHFHPSHVCYCCFLKLGRLKKEKQLNKGIKKCTISLATWTEDEIEVKQPKVQFEDGFITKCIEVFNKYGFSLSSRSSDHCIFSRIFASAERVFCTLTINSDKTFQVRILGRTIEPNTCIPNGSEPLCDPADINRLLKLVTTAKICPGNNDFSDIQTEQDMPSGTNYETGYGIGETIRHSKCTIIITDPSSERCEFCAHFRATLFNIRRRLKVKQQTFHANTRNNYLKPEELRHKLITANKENRQIKRKLNSVYDQVRESVRKDGVTLELKLNKSCSQMATNLKEQLLSSFKEDTPEHILVTEQLRAVNTANAKTMRWHPTFLRWCINLYGKSPAAYRMIKGSKFLILPHESTLRDYTSFLKVSPGINVPIIENIVKDMEDKMELDTFRNNVTLVFDEIKIKSGLVYSKSTGKLKGFVSLGEINSINHDFAKQGENDEQLASHVIAFMVRGMFSHLKEVFAYYPCTGFTSDQLFWAVWEAVFVLEGCGLKVRAFVSDGASPNRKFYKIHALPDSGTPVNSATNLYDLSRKIYFVCDVPHLIKTTRNNLENSNWNKRTRLLRFNNLTMEWPQLMTLVQHDLQGQGLRMLPKVSTNHLYLNPSLRMKVKLAVQILSNSVAQALISRGNHQYQSLATFISNMNIFFDCLNVSSASHNVHPNKRPYTSVDDRRLKWLTDEFLVFLEEWEQQCLATPGLSMSEKRRMCLSRETLEGLRITVKSFVQLTNELLAIDGVRFFLSERLSQDPIEEFFSKVRGHLGHNCHPTLNQFESALVHIHTLGGQDMQATRHGNINWRGDGMLLNPNNLNRRHRRADD